jgi:hypothetical protein
MYGHLIGWLGTMSPRDVVIGTALAFFLGWAAEDALEQPARAPDPLWGGSGSKNQMAGIASAGSWCAARMRMRSFYRFAQDREAP